ncbi:hypothetical protein BG011_000662 [Mortierella polycephala]|uniref:Uncharacterized protein n=1 Tax=Mortierella polycephala TaxID=41804 RepID=A0A9P6PK71_9FUNG|nr:hypothetical protein BG011_000662 [Mortierella polycephala]
MEIGRYYRPLPLQQRKAYGGDGYILFDRSSSDKTFPPLPESIKVGGHIINTKMADLDTNTDANVGTGPKKAANVPPPPQQQQATNPSRAHQPKSKNIKRNGKKRLKTAVQVKLGPNDMEEVLTPPQEVAATEHQAESPAPAKEHQTDQPAPETQSGEKLVTQDNGRNHALAPLESGASPENSPLSMESDSESEQESASDSEGDPDPIINIDNNTPKQPERSQRPKRNGHVGTYNMAQLSQASAQQSQQ